ncbi:MAG TPA: hypothetical protein VFK32_00130, partial [Tepidiformaceae bacterium]|nr:hypothetical protein [Tepidiformaceae bacterium]
MLLDAIQPEPLWRSLPNQWEDWILAQASADPHFRARLLQFVDVLPALRSSAAVAEHVRLYFADDPGSVVRLGARTASSRLARPVLSRVVRQAMFRMADRFIAGSASDRVLPTLAKLLLQGTGYTIDVLGEATLSDAEADEQVARYRAMLDTLTGLRIPGAGRRFAPNISLKLSAFTPHLEPAAPEKTITVLRARLFPLLRAARA